MNCSMAKNSGGTNLELLVPVKTGTALGMYGKSLRSALLKYSPGGPREGKIKSGV